MEDKEARRFRPEDTKRYAGKQDLKRIQRRRRKEGKKTERKRREEKSDRGRMKNE